MKEGDRNLEVQEALQEKYKELETEKKELEDKYARVAEEVNVLAKKRYNCKILQYVINKLVVGDKLF